MTYKISLTIETFKIVKNVNLHLIEKKKQKNLLPMFTEVKHTSLYLTFGAVRELHLLVAFFT